MRRLPLLLVLVLAAALVPPARSAVAGDPFVFSGSGYGHGLGMSQWGAFGLAREGWTAEEILGHYYRDTQVGPTTFEEPLRVGLANGRASLRIEAVEGPVTLTVGGGTTVVPAGETWTVRAGPGTFDLIPPAGGAITAIPSSPQEPMVLAFDGARVRFPELGRTYARGQIEFGLHLCAATCSVRAVLVIDVEEYLLGLAEVPSSWPEAALQAQVIAGRSYAIAKASVTQRRSPCDCALYANTYDQVYAGYEKEAGTDGDRWVAAVEATAGLVVLYEDEVAMTFYMSSSGGHTEDNEAVWGGTPLPYIRGVCDPGDYVEENPSATWTVTETADEVTAALSLGIGTVTGFEVIERGVSGRIISVVVRGDAGEATISGGTLRSRLGLRDSRVWIDQERLVTGEVREKYDALACLPGLPLSRLAPIAGGSRQRFEQATIFVSPGGDAAALWGEVLRHYLSLRGPRGDLGFPLSDVTTTAKGATRAAFERGRITCGPGGACTARLRA